MVPILLKGESARPTYVKRTVRAIYGI